MSSTIVDRNRANPGLAIKAPVRLATTANDALYRLTVVDGVQLVDGDRVLVKDQTNAIQNGIFIARNGNWDRAPDWDGFNDAVEDTWIFVQQGTVNADKIYAVATSGDINVGITEVTFTEKTLSPTYPINVSQGGTGATDAATARTNLGLGTIATQAASNVAITGGSIVGITDLAVADGGTGASVAADARTNLGLGSIATQDASSVSITGGAISGITDLAVADGGTGASTAADARTNLGLGTIATQNANSVAITGGSVTGITDIAIADGGTGASTASAAFDALKQAATESATGVAEIATQAETNTGSDDARFVTPSKLDNRTWTATGGSAARTLAARFSDVINVKDFGAIGDGTTDDTSAITAADDLGRAVFVPNGTYDTTLAATALDGPYYGIGKIRDTDNNLRARYFSAIKAAPSTLGTESALSTSFNGDWSKGQFPVEHRITGAATLGQPASGYLYTPEAYPFYVWLYNESGHNESTSANTGRTSAVAFRTKIYNAGQGDCVAYNASGFVTGAKASATSFLANPAASLFNGDLTAGQAGVYLNPYETVIDDNGFDVAGVGNVNRLDRTVATGALGAYWAGYRVQSEGTQPIDVGLSIVGASRFGIDLSFGTYTSNAAINLKADQRINFNVTATDSTGLSRYPSATNNDYIFYNSGLSAVQIVVGNASSMQFYSNQVVATQHFNVANTFEYRYNGVKVVGARNTGWTAFTGTTNKATSYATGTVTLVQLAERVAAIQAAITTHGLFGA